MLARFFFVALTCLCIVSCAQPTQQITQNAGFKQEYIATSKFNLNTYYKLQGNTNVGDSDAVNVYIEGDGHVLANRRMISKDPTPHSNLVVQLAIQDPNPNVFYLSRPCQRSPQDLTNVCNNKYWTSARYSEEVVNSINQALSSIKQQSHARKINLIGYSGGASLAVLVAARRNDIASIRTIAGNLDLATMDNIHKTERLYESLDPASVAQQVKSIPQIHFVGSKDWVVPEPVAQAYCRAAGLDQKHIKVLAGVSHEKGWLKEWPELLAIQP